MNLKVRQEKNKPWSIEEGGKERQYVVCQACDNPIQIIGLYEPLAHTARPYGRHTRKRIKGFEDFDPEVFTWCPYVKKRTARSRKQKRAFNDIALKTLGIVLFQFDRIIYILEKETGLQISEKLAQNILDHWLTGEGYLYSGANLQNIPWMVAYRTRSLSIFGQKIVDNERLKANIEKNIPSAKISEDGRITNGSKFCAVNGVFLDHRTKFEDGDLKETIRFEVSTDSTNQNKRKIVYAKTILIEPNFFERLVNLPADRARRKQSLLTLADNMFRAKLKPAVVAKLKSY